jgi:hypothetical protein
MTPLIDSVADVIDAPGGSTQRLRGDVVGYVAAALSFVSCAGLHIYAAWDGTGPIFATDEVGYLANAQLLSGVGAPRDLAFSSYYLGWSIPLVPLWWLLDDPGQVYRGAMVLSVLAAILVIWPLAAVAHRLGVSTPWAVVLAAAVAGAPARVIQSNFALAENFLMLLTAVTVLLALRFAERPSHARAALLGFAAAWVFTTHGRMVSVLLATLLWFGWLALRRNRAALTGGAVAVAVTVPMFLLYRWVADQMYAPTMDREARGLSRLFDLDPAAAVLAAGGQAWYVVVSWFGLAALGAVALVWLGVAEARSRRPGPAAWGVVGVVGTLAISVTWISAVVARGDNRYDIYSYGRYLDWVAALLTLLGLSVLWSRGGTVRLRVAGLVSALTIGAFLAVVVPRAPDNEETWWGPNSVAGLLQWDWPDITAAQRPPWVIASTATALVLVVLLSLPPRLHRLGALGVATALLTSAWIAQIKTLDPFFAAWYGSFTLHELVAEMPDATIAFDVAGIAELEGGADTVSRNAYQYWLAPRAVDVIDTSDAGPTTDLVIARSDWPAGERLGAVKIAEDDGLFDNALWVLPHNDSAEPAGD